jgi:hypothetical protein
VKVLLDLNNTFLQSLASQAETSALIGTAFLKGNAFESICKKVKDNCRKVILTRWQFRDLVSGASDLEAFTCAQKYGWKFFYNQDLHAKLYIFDNQAVIGSSNLTNRGLGGQPPAGNIELSTQLPVEKGLLDWFDNLIRKSILVDAELFEAISFEVNKFQTETKTQTTIRKGFSQNVLKILKQRNIHKTLFLQDLPETFDPLTLLQSNNAFDPDICHDLSVLGLPFKTEIHDIKVSFEISPSFIWLLEKVKSSIHFGELSVLLHEEIYDDPKPYRGEIKRKLANLINWASTLCPEYFQVDVPGRRSQRLTRIYPSN